MHQHVGVKTASLIIALVSSISFACAQAAPGNVEMPTGDVWQSEAEHIYLPPPDATDDWEVPSSNLLASPSPMTPQTKSTAPSEHKSFKFVPTPCTSIRSGEHRSYVASVVGRRSCLRHRMSRDVRRAHCAVDVWRPDSHIGGWCL